MQTRQKRPPKKDQTETVYLPEGNFKALKKYSRKRAFNDFCPTASVILEFIACKHNLPNNTCQFTNAMIDLKDGNHLHTERNLEVLGQYKSAKYMEENPTSEFIWEYLRATAMIGFIMDDPIILELLYKHLETSLFQDLVSATLILALNFDSRKCFSTLYKIHKGKFVWSNNQVKRIELYIPFKALPKQIKEIAKNGFSISNQTLFRYLKFLERQPQNEDKMRYIFTNFGIFKISEDRCIRCLRPSQFIIEDKFYKLDSTIQILLIKIATDNNFNCFDVKDVTTEDSFMEIYKLSKHLSKVTDISGIRYQDFGRLIACISHLHTHFKLKFSDQQNILLTVESLEEIAEIFKQSTYHLRHVKGVTLVAGNAAQAAFKSVIDCTLYAECIDPKSQIDFINTLCVALIAEKDAFSMAIS